MGRSKGLAATGLALWVVFSLFYYNIFNLVPYYKIEAVKIKFMPFISKEYMEAFNESGEYLLNTPGCAIPNYGRTMVFKPPNFYKEDCERRGIFVEAISDDEMEFTIIESIIVNKRKEKTPYTCCYKFVTRPNSTKPGVNDTEIKLSECIPFKNGTKAKLKHEVVTVRCNSAHNSSYFYHDAYILIKKILKKETKEEDPEKWNVLMLGMDTMSRERSRRTLPLTMQFFKNNSWLDFKAYHKIGDNTYPNLMAVLAGDAKLTSNQSMDMVNHLLMWSRYKSAGYATAYGEDFLKLPDTFKNYGGFEIPPTDHYMRPFFLLGEYVAGNRLCSWRMPSAAHLLDYARQFTRTYKKEGYFGFFWMNSYSHNQNNNPELIDIHISTFLNKLTNADINNNTFVIFMSDHGIRFGETRHSVESFYEERLPMLYMWVPYKFREQFPEEYYNMQVNQNRLVTPYDLHATLWDILKKSSETVTVIKSPVCPSCTSIFYEKTENRTCSEAAISEKWCSCHQLKPLNRKIPEAQKAISTAFFALKNITSNVKTKECTKCARVGLKTLLRVHKYYNNENNKTHFLVAFLTTPGDAGYEVMVDEEKNGFKVTSPLSTISSYNTRGSCVIKRSMRGYCICSDKRGCKKHG